MKKHIMLTALSLGLLSSSLQCTPKKEKSIAQKAFGISTKVGGLALAIGSLVYVNKYQYKITPGWYLEKLNQRKDLAEVAFNLCAFYGVYRLIGNCFESDESEEVDKAKLEAV